MTAQLRLANKRIRLQRPVDDSSLKCCVFAEGDLLELSLPSYRCRHDLQGSCIMCNYGTGAKHKLNTWQITQQLNLIKRQISQNFHTLLLSTNGSILDRHDVGKNILEEVYKIAENLTFETIIIETHLDTLSQEKLSSLRSRFPKKQIILEIGLESSNSFVQEYCFLKNIPLEQVQWLLKIASNYNIGIQVNVILGAPFLSRAEQIEDAEKTIRWVLDKGALVALFPMNIKPFTLLNFAFQNNIYAPISHWAVPILLSHFTGDELERIDLAWYGNREIRYDNPDIVTTLPIDCELCRDILLHFYQAYVLAKNGNARHNAVEKVLCSSRCDCLNTVLSSLNVCQAEQLDIRVKRLHERLICLLKKESVI